MGGFVIIAAALAIGAGAWAGWRMGSASGSTAALLAALAIGAGAWAGWRMGHVSGVKDGIEQGRAQQQAAQATRTLDEMAQMLRQHAALVDASSQASAAMRAATAQRAQVDARSTQEIRDALKVHASGRVGCVFDAGVMRSLTAAHDRACFNATGSACTRSADAALCGATGTNGQLCR